MKTLIKNDDRMFELEEDDNGDLFLIVVAGGIAMYEVRVRLSDEEKTRYFDEGVAFIEDLAYRVAKDPASRA